MTRRMWLWLCAGLPFSTRLSAGTPEFERRVRSVIDAYAHPKGSGPLGYANIAAKLWLHEDAALCSRSLEELLAAGPTGDMFWMFPITGDRLPGSGPTLRFRAPGAAQFVPNLHAVPRRHGESLAAVLHVAVPDGADVAGQDGDQWYTGKSSEENLREAAGWIESWVRLTTTRGQGEYDSPHYMGLYFLSMSYLAEWAKDPAMKKRATMMLDYLIADYAAENLDGIYVGAHSRVYDRPVLEKWLNVVERFRLGAVRPGPPARSAGQLHHLLSPGQRLRAAGDPEADRHRPQSTLHSLRAQAHPQPLAVLRRPARAGL